MDRRKKGLVLFFLAFAALVSFNYPVIEHVVEANDNLNNTYIFKYLHITWLVIIVVIGVVTYVSRLEKQTPLDD